MLKLADFTKITPYHYTKSLNSTYRVELIKFNTWRIELYKSEKLIWVCDGYSSQSDNKVSNIPGKVLFIDLNRVIKQYV